MRSIFAYAVSGVVSLSCSSTFEPESNGQSGSGTPASRDASATPQPPVDGTTDSHEMPPAILSFDVGPQHTISFHEVGDAVLVVESASDGVPSVLNELSPAPASVIYETLRPGEEAPLAITDAMERTRARRVPIGDAMDGDLNQPLTGGGTPARVQQTREDGVAQLSQAVSASYFTNNLNGCYVPPNSSGNVCRTEWANGYFATKKAEIASWTVASQYGAPTVKLTFGGGNTYVETIPHKRYNSYMVTGELCCPIFCFCAYHPRTLRIDIIDAQGVIFHVGGYWIG